MRLADYLTELRSVPKEVPLEPELKSHRQQQDKKLREEQDLNAGVILQAVAQEGEGANSPAEGDLVYVHYTVRSVEDDDVLYSTRSQQGGSGQPLAFRLEKGMRAPRAWEIALKGMKRKQINVLKVKPSYGYRHPDCQLQPPPGCPPDSELAFELELVHWYPAKEVRHFGSSEDVYRRVLQEGTSWESPRAPFEVTFHCTACVPAYDGIQMSGFNYFSTDQMEPLFVQLGQRLLPPGLEEALCCMSKGEIAVFVVSAASMAMEPAAAAAAGPGAARCLLPAPPAKSAQVEMQLQLIDMVQVRDITGSGEVMKKRLKEGTGEFPIDCPLHDTTVSVHYKVRSLGSSGSSSGSGSSTEAPVWAYDTRQAGTGPVEFDTGCGEAPDGLEQCIKLMVPRELASVVCQPQFGYSGRDDCPAGIRPDDVVEFEVELVDFQREGYWQNLSMEERFAVAERMKGKGNKLYKANKFRYARSRYDRLLRLLDSTRDFETQEEMDKIDALKLAVLSNLALCAHQLEEYSEAISYCNKALQHSPDSAKLLFRRGKALSLKGDHEAAEEDFARAKELEPTIARDVDKEAAVNKQRARAAVQKQKSQFKNFFDRS